MVSTISYCQFVSYFRDGIRVHSCSVFDGLRVIGWAYSTKVICGFLQTYRMKNNNVAIIYIFISHFVEATYITVINFYLYISQ